MQIKVRVTRDVLTPSLRRKLETARNPRKALQAIGLVVVSMAQRAFTQADLRPSVWPPLKPATIKTKRRSGKSTKPLIAEGVLARSPRIVSVDNRRVVVGTDRTHGKYHQLGTKHTPARPFFPFRSDGRPTDRARRTMLAAADRALALDRK